MEQPDKKPPEKFLDLFTKMHGNLEYSDDVIEELLWKNNVTKTDGEKYDLERAVELIQNGTRPELAKKLQPLFPDIIK